MPRQLFASVDEAVALDGLRHKTINYDPARAPEDGQADGHWHVDSGDTVIGQEPPGPPVPGGAWETGCTLVRQYEFAEPRILRGVYRASAELDGRDMLLEGRFTVLRFYLGVRVTAVIDETTEAERVWGWSYQTLEGHLEQGRLTYEVIDLLNRTFVTPLDRDDMYRLVTAIDDVCDHIDEAADNIDAYEVTDVPARARDQADVLYRAASRLHDAIELLEGFGDAQKHLFALRELEDEGDRLSREAVADLFRSGADPLTIIRWKDIHEQIEEAVDACENAADVLEAILVKNR